MTITAPARVSVPVSADVAAIVGLTLTVVGTFLPWLHSGSTTRNSYATGGALQRLLDLHGALGALLDVWPFLSLACAGAVALLVLRYVWPGLVVALIATACAGGAAFAALASDVQFVVRPATIGPAVTTAGAVLVWLAATVRTVRTTRRFR